MSLPEMVYSNRLRCMMKVSQTNHTYLELIREKEGLDSLNTALSKIIEVARPFFSRRSSKSIQKVALKKKGDMPSLHLDKSKEESVFNNEKYEDQI